MKIPLGSNSVLKIHDEGIMYVGVAAIATVISILLSGMSVVTFFLIVMTCSVAAFFRDPERIHPKGEKLIIAPADGIIVDIKEENAPSEIAGNDVSMMKISIFLSVFNVHVNRVPVAGKIVNINYNPGKFINASLDKASKDNERNTIAIETETGELVYCTQIAGLVARRIICDAEIGNFCAAGQRYGIIRFGSRVDIYIPKSYRIDVAVGQTMVGGETIIGKIN